MSTFRTCWMSPPDLGWKPLPCLQNQVWDKNHCPVFRTGGCQSVRPTRFVLAPDLYVQSWSHSRQTSVVLPLNFSNSNTINWNWGIRPFLGQNWNWINTVSFIDLFEIPWAGTTNIFRIYRISVFKIGDWCCFVWFIWCSPVPETLTSNDFYKAWWFFKT